MPKKRAPKAKAAQASQSSADTEPSASAAPAASAASAPAQELSLMDRLAGQCLLAYIFLSVNPALDRGDAKCPALPAPCKVALKAIRSLVCIFGVSMAVPAYTAWVCM